MSIHDGTCHPKKKAKKPREVDETALKPVSAIVNTLTGHVQTVGIREANADRFQGVNELRQQTADLRQEAANLRREATDLREQAAQFRNKLINVGGEIEKATTALDVHSDELLLEANEQLVIATVRAQTMAEIAEQSARQMAHMAEHDFLTGLPNRALLTDRLERSIALAKRQNKKVALMYLDLDHFKHINDSLGHSIGDQLLQSVAKSLLSCVRFSDTVSRQGGDEFVVMLADVEDADGAVLTAQKLMEAVSQTHLIGIHRLHVTLSIGISLYPDDGKDIETVVRNADTAMYYAKKSGRNKYQVFTPEMKVRAVRRQSVRQALHKALELDRFVLHYQPKVNLETGAITGAEALVRWQRSNKRLAYPTQFISIAEDCGLIVPIGRWVLREACLQTQAWLRDGLEIDQMAVNVSAMEFQEKDFLAGVHEILTDTDMDPRHLTFELTETGLMQDTQKTMSTLHELKDMGAQIAIDDFGTGYSSLSYLRSFPIDELKIDQSFVQDIDGGPGDAIVSAVIAIGKSLKHRVVAEGIETPEQLAFLQSRDCAEGQGYYFCRPVAADAFAELYKACLQ
jgi:diguanylate cyclase (GGDEF)-like protein